jgi:Uma2 family endonuclease
MSVITSPTMTIGELAERQESDRFELVHGELVERTLNPYAAIVAGKIYRRLDEYADLRSDILVVPDGAGFRLDEDTLRKPDVAVVLRSRLVDGAFPEPCFPFPPDLAIEVVSPSDQFGQVADQVAGYLHAGTSAVWVVRPESRLIEVHLAVGGVSLFGPTQEVTGSPVISEFRLLVGDFFPLLSFAPSHAAGG